MAHPITPAEIDDILFNRRQVYSLDTDSLIRQVANRLTARTLFELLGRLDVEAVDFASHLSGFLSEFGAGEVAYLLAFDTGDVPRTAPEAEELQQPGEPTEYYLKLVFRDEQAAYYQFNLFPDLNATYVLGAARKRAGAIQHLQL